MQSNFREILGEVLHNIPRAFSWCKTLPKKDVESLCMQCVGGYSCLGRLILYTVVDRHTYSIQGSHREKFCATNLTRMNSVIISQ